MATEHIGFATAPRGRDKLYPYQINTAGMKEGAFVVFDSTAAASMVKAPAGAAPKGVAGLIADVQNVTTGTVVGTDVNLQRDGIGLALLGAGLSVTEGAALVVAGTDGSVRAFVGGGTDNDCDIVGYAEETKTAGAVAETLKIRVAITYYNKGAA